MRTGKDELMFARKPRIVLADDEIHIRYLIRNVMLAEGYEVAGEVNNGEDAVAMYREVRPDLIVMDINLPLKTGDVVLADILGEFPDAKVVMLTMVASRCPGRAILAAYDQAAYWREQGRCVISGFHSAVEEECLRILLRGKQPIIICLARAMYSKIPPEWQKPLVENRLLILSAFPSEKRVTADLAQRRNELVAALAEEVYFVHIVAQGHTAHLAKRVAEWDIRSVSCDHR